MWPFNKKQKPAVRQRGFNAAAFNRLVDDWVAGNASADAELKGSLPVLRNRARDFGRNNDYVREIYRQFQNNVVGEGIRFQAQVKMQRGNKLDDRQNDLIETAWARWCRKENCDVAGLLSFEDIQRLAIRSVIESGEVIVRKVYQKFGKSKIPLGLEIVESDLLDDGYNGIASNGNAIRMGVEVDQWKRPTAYYFFHSHPGDYPAENIVRRTQRLRVPASEVIHLYVVDRPGQSRGIPQIVSSIMRLRHMQGYEEASVIAARAAAANMGFIQTPDGQPSIADSTDAQGETVSEFSPGLIKTLGPGETFAQSNFQAPSGQLDPFMRFMLRGVTAGSGTAYETVSGDFSQSNYSSSRMAMLKERDNWRVLQKWFIANFCQVVFESWLDLAVLSGELPLKGYEVNEEAYTCVRWKPRGWAWIDPAKEVAANEKAVLGGFTTRTDIIAAEGGDIEELHKTRRRELDDAADHDLKFSTDPGADQSGKDAPPPEGEDPEEPPKKPKSDG